jgi:hypothetical protein
MSAIRLGDLLLRAGVITEPQLAAALHEQRQWGGRLGSILVRMGVLSEDLLVKALARQLNMPRAALGPTDVLQVPPAILQRIDRATCERLVIVPVGYAAERRAVQIAIADPNNIVALDDLGRRVGLRVETLIAGETQIHQAIIRLYVGDTGLDPTLGGEGLQLMDNGGAARPSARTPTAAMSMSTTPAASPTSTPPGMSAGFLASSGATGTFPAPAYAGAATGRTGSFTAPPGLATAGVPGHLGSGSFAGPGFAGGMAGATGTFAQPAAGAFGASYPTATYAAAAPIPDEHRQIAEQQHRALRVLVELLIERGVLTAAELHARLR